MRSYFLLQNPKPFPSSLGTSVSELGSGVNDSAVRCQSRTLTEPQRERWLRQQTDRADIVCFMVFSHYLSSPPPPLRRSPLSTEVERDFGTAAPSYLFSIGGEAAQLLTANCQLLTYYTVPSVS